MTHVFITIEHIFHLMEINKTKNENVKSQTKYMKKE